MSIKSILRKASMLVLTFCITMSGVVHAAGPIISSESIITSDCAEVTGEIIAEETYFIDAAGNMYLVSEENVMPCIDYVDMFTATFYYTGLNSSGYKSYKVTYTLTSLEDGRYYTSSTLYATPKNSVSTHSSTSTWSASEKKTTVSDSLSYYYTSNPPDEAGVTISCSYNTTTGTGYIISHSLSSPIDIS